MSLIRGRAVGHVEHHGPALRLVETPTVPAGTYADAWPVLRNDGWTGVLPLGAGTKDPPPSGFTGWTGDDTSGADCAELAEQRRYRNTPQTALRIPTTVVGIDVDGYGTKAGRATLAEAERQWGPLPVGPWSSARDDGVSGIRFLRIPAGTVLQDVIDGQALGNVPGLGGIEVIQHHHRYALVWPSIHPSTGTPYTWRETDGPALHPRVDELPALPDAWLEGLRRLDARPGEAKAAAGVVAAFETAHTADNGRAGAGGAVSTFERDVKGGKARHDSLVSALCMVAREAGAGRYPAASWRRVETAFVERVTADGSRTERRAYDEAASAWAYAVGQVAHLDVEQCEALCAPSGIGRARQVWPSAANANTTAPAEASAAPHTVQLPAEFWEARPALQHIRDAARARYCAPDAVLGAALARQGAYLNPGDSVDLGLGDGAPMSVYAILLGPPGAGKGKAVRTAAELLPVPPHLADFRERSLGSGEGIVDAYYGTVQVEPEDGRGKAKTVRQQVRTNVLFVLDEGEALVKMITQRGGTTVAQTIRSSWSGENIGQANANADRDRQLNRAGYAIGLVLGFQPDTIAPLFDPEQVGGGTPHRFLFMSAIDPHAPDEAPEWPGPLEVAEPVDATLTRQWSPGTHTRYVLTDDEVRARVQASRLAILRGEHVLDEQDTHGAQYCGRIAAHLARWDGRTDVTGDDWKLAGLVMHTSAAGRDEAIEHGRTRTRNEHAARTRSFVERQAEAAVRTADAIEEREQQQALRVAAIIARKVCASGSDGVTRTVLRDAAGGRNRAALPDAIAAAVARSWIEQGEDRRYRPGASGGDVPDA